MCKREAAQLNKIEDKGKAVPVHAMGAYRGLELWLHSFLTSVLDGGEYSYIKLHRVKQNYPFYG
jgi:hypothetical protein